MTGCHLTKRAWNEDNDVSAPAPFRYNCLTARSQVSQAMEVRGETSSPSLLSG
jgi:hypothetical protein